MFTNNSNLLFILILAILFNFSGEDGINGTESAVLIMAMLALLLTGGNLFGCGCNNNCNCNRS